eukprot:2807615-Pleurochrysis_carterae.AAC.4
MFALHNWKQPFRMSRRLPLRCSATELYVCARACPCLVSSRRPAVQHRGGDVFGAAGPADGAARARAAHRRA